MLAYQLYMLTGQTALSHLQNGRYPGLSLERFTQFAARTLPEPGRCLNRRRTPKEDFP